MALKCLCAVTMTLVSVREQLRIQDIQMHNKRIHTVSIQCSIKLYEVELKDSEHLVMIHDDSEEIRGIQTTRLLSDKHYAQNTVASCW